MVCATEGWVAVVRVVVGRWMVHTVRLIEFSQHQICLAQEQFGAANR